MTAAPVRAAARAAPYAPPRVPSQIVRRERVMRAFNDARDASVICLNAPGGYGKTLAAAQWLATDDRPVVWLSVRPAAADADWLVQALLDGLIDRGLLVGGLPTLAGSPNPASWHLGTLPLVEHAVANAAEPFVVVVDNAHALSGSRWECLAETLALSLPAGSQLILGTRRTMPATLWRLRSRGQVAVIGPQVLAFDEGESIQVLRRHGLRPSVEQARGLVAATDGWPVAVNLAGSIMTPTWQPSEPFRAGLELTDYLRDQIVGAIPVADADFLSRVSVLSTLDADDCDEVASVTGSLARLRHLASDEHLLWAEDEYAERFRMNPVLSDALSVRLREQNPAAWRATHVAASRVDERRGDFDAAVHHAKIAGDDSRLAELIWSRAPHLLASGQYTVLERWLDGIDEDRLGGRCGLALSSAWVASHAGDMPRVNRLALAAEGRAAVEDPAFTLDVDLLDATIGSQGLGHMEAVARSFIAGKPHGDPWQTLAYFLLGVALLLRDEPKEATAALGEGRRLSIAHELPVMVAHCLAGLADAAVAAGDGHKALACVREARALAVRHRMDTIATAAPIFTTSAWGYVQEGRFADARREASRALRLTALIRTMVPWHAVQGRLVLAQVNLALGDPERARVLVDEAGDERGPATESVVLDRMFTQTQDRLSTVSTSLDGASSLTTAEVRVLQYLPTHLSFPQIADELFVSRHTVKTQAMSAYRKLGVHSRTEAIVRARRAGLLPPG